MVNYILPFGYVRGKRVPPLEAGEPALVTE